MKPQHLCGVLLAAALALATPFLTAAATAAPGRVQGRVLAGETGEPIGFADVVLIPADTTMRRVGGFTNADGTFLLEAAPGRYDLKLRALSYASKTIQGLVVESGGLLPLSTALQPEAIVQEEVVVEGRLRQNTETSLLAARRKAAAVGDAVSSEQVRRAPDKDAAEVLRRVTGLSVSDGKFVFVRGLGERYSSTEVDGVRLASPEQNKRVVPLDIVPAGLLESIVVQKTYTADRPGEFGGGDVQVRTKDFPGNRTWSLSVTQGVTEGVTFRQRATYRATRADVYGFGADDRRLPDALFDVAGNGPLSERYSAVARREVAEGFRNVWSPGSVRAIPNAGYALTYGDELKLFGRPLGLIESLSLTRSFQHQDETQRYFSSAADTLFDYAVQRSKESVLLGGMSGLSYRLSPRHSLHARGLWTHGADDEVRVYEGPDHNRTESTTGEWLRHRDTRLLYVERDVRAGTLEGRHEPALLRGASLDWKLNASRARRLQPDRRETTYDHRDYLDGDGNLVGYWGLGSGGSREFGDLHDRGLGTTVSGALPYRLGRLGSGRLSIGFDRQTKDRTNAYRRFVFSPNEDDPTALPESLFSRGANVVESTLNQDNYDATQRVTAGYLSVDVPLGRRLRGTFGVRAEHGTQDVRSFDLLDPSRTTAEGGYENTDWLPSGNLTWAATDALNLRFGASRTLSRPDLNELSPSPSLDYVGGFLQTGNPDLRRALIENYDVRVEAFPALSEVLAAGFFYKNLRDPIEQQIRPGTPLVLAPNNSEGGRNLGVELEARAGLARIWAPLQRFSLNANASIISSQVRLRPELTPWGAAEHPLQGQADYIVNGTLTYASASGRTDASVLLSGIGKRLRTVGLATLGDVYDQPSASLDATLNLSPGPHTRLKLAAKNLLDPRIQQLQGGKEITGYRTGRSYALSFSYNR